MAINPRGRRWLTTSLCIAAGLLTAAFAQGAVIKSFQKISATQGGFSEAGGVIDDGDDFGESLDVIGDLDGDGIIDLVVGMKEDDDGGEGRGAVYILFMRTNGTVDRVQKISDLEGGFTGVLNDGDTFGRGSTGLGDIDGDGVLDIAVGASRDDDGPGTNNGAVWILFLNTDGTVKAHQKISEEHGNLNLDVRGFGSDLEMLGDLDGDGTGDLWVSEGEGFINVYLNPDGTVKRTVRIVGDNGFASNGALLGDLDDDGVLDLAVGAPSNDDGGTNRGAVWIVYMNADGTEKSRAKISSLTGGFTGLLEDGDEFGQSVTPVGDRNGDGIPDLVVGAEHADAPECTSGIDNQCKEKNTGEVWILHLNRNGTVKSHEFIASDVENFTTIRRNSNIGQAVTFPGDLDLDGVPDIATSADGDIDGGGVQNGSVYVIFLAPYGANGSAPPQLAPIGNRTVIEGDLLTIPVTATDNDGPPPLRLSVNGAPADADFVDFGGGQGEFTWTPDAGAAADSPYSVTFRATEDDGNGLADSETISITVLAPGGSGGILSGSSAVSGDVDLTAAGPVDWAHWKGGAIDLIRRDGPAQISDYQQIGNETPVGAGAAVSYSWTNGTPIGNSTATDGIRVFSVGSGFRVAAPADTASRTLRMYLGAKRARGMLRATLSDGSAPAYSTFIDFPGGLGTSVVTLNYQAASAGQTLTVEYTMDTRYRSGLKDSQINLESAALAGATGGGGGGNQAPVLQSIGNQTVTEGNLLTVPVQASDSDGPPPLRLSVNGAPADADFVDFGGGQGEFSWTPDAGAAADSPYSVTFRATEDDGNGLADSETVSITVLAPGGAGGILSGSSAVSSDVDLTAAGPVDWTHWKGGAINLIRRDGPAQISDYQQIGNETPVGAGAAVSYSWTNGTPVASNSANDGIRVFNIGSGFQVTAPASTGARTLRMYLGAKRARGMLRATLSDGSAPAYSTFIDFPGGLGTSVVTLNFQAASAGQTLTVEYTMDTRYRNDLKDSQINLESAALQ